MIVSDLASAEFSSAAARKHRAEGLSREDALIASGALDLWIGIAAERVPISSRDVLRAEEAVRLLDPPVRALDAIHLAVTRRLGATLVTFDRQLAAAAQAFGVPLALP